MFATEEIRCHPAHDVAMEILAVMPKSPITMPMALVMQDLGIPFRSVVRNAVDRIRHENGVGIKRFQAKSGAEYLTIISGWDRAQKAAESYLDLVGG